MESLNSSGGFKPASKSLTFFLILSSSRILILRVLRVSKQPLHGVRISRCNCSATARFLPAVKSQADSLIFLYEGSGQHVNLLFSAKSILSAFRVLRMLFSRCGNRLGMKQPQKT